MNNRIKMFTDFWGEHLSRVKMSIIALFALPVLMFCTNVNAKTTNHFADCGPYLTGQIGSGSVEYGLFDGLFDSMDIKNNSGLAGRVALGSQIFHYFGIELGAAMYPCAERNYNSSRGLFGAGDYTGSSKITDVYSADLIALLRLPILNYLYLSAGGGVAAMHFKYESMHAESEYETILSWASGSGYFFAPKALMRVGVKFNRNFDLFAGVSYIFCVNGNDPSQREYQPGLGLASVGTSFHF